MASAFGEFLFKFHFRFSLENDPNMQLSCAAEAAAAAGGQPVNDYPARPILHDRGKKQS